MAKQPTTNIFMDWLKQNLITLAVLLVSMAIAWGMLSARVQAMEQQVAKYPSQDWFELKFQNIDDRFDVVEKNLDGKANRNEAPSLVK